MCVRARQRHPRHNIFFRRGSGLGSFIPSVQCLDCSSALASELGEFCLFSDIKFRELIELRFAVVLPTNHHYEYRLLTFSAKAGSGGCDCSSSKEAYANLRKFFYLFNSRIGARGGVKIFGFPLGFQRVRANRHVLAASLLLITAASLAACGGGSTSGPNSVPITASPTPVPDAPFSVVTSLPVNASGTIAAPISAPGYAGTLSFGGVSSPARTWSFLVINITCRYRWLSQQQSRNLCWERPVRFSLRTPEVRLQFYYHGRGIAWHSGSRLGGLPTQATGSRSMRRSIAMQIRKTVRG